MPIDGCNYHDSVFKGLELNRDDHDVVLKIEKHAPEEIADEELSETALREKAEGTKAWSMVPVEEHLIKVVVDRNWGNPVNLNLEAPPAGATIQDADDGGSERGLTLDFIGGSLNIRYEQYTVEKHATKAKKD